MIAVSLIELGAKARVLNRQAGGNVEVVIEAGAVAERRLIASILKEAARLLPKPKRARPPVPGSRARLAAAGGVVQPHPLTGQ